MANFSPHHLKWLHQFKGVTFLDNNDAEEKKTEVFFSTDDEAIHNVNMFLDSHDASDGTMNIEELLMKDIARPVEQSLKAGVKDIRKSPRLTKLRRRKIEFIIREVLVRMYKHENFHSVQNAISVTLTGMLALIANLYTANPRDKDSAKKMDAYFKAKEFLTNISFLIWAECFHDAGIALAEDLTLPYLRKLAMLDLLDTDWSYAGSWEGLLNMLDLKHDKNHARLSSDKAINETTRMIRLARKSIWTQTIALSGYNMENYVEDDYPESLKGIIREYAPQIFRYYPKCSAFMCSEVETPAKPHRLRCYRCHYYHWCSPACQRTSEEIECQHQKYCGHLPDEVVMQCRVESEEFLGIRYADELKNAGVKCHACGIHKSQAKSLNRCSKCKSVHYCSRACQIWDWDTGNHRLTCTKNSMQDGPSSKMGKAPICGLIH